ncbi:MAG: isocitrate lyase [Bacteroidota bacterium]
MNNRAQQIDELISDWLGNPRWKNVIRPYKAKEVINLRGRVKVEYTLAKRGAEKLWSLLQEEDPISCLGAMTGNQAIQEVEAGLKAIYCSGWQVAGDANTAETMYPDQSLYPVDSVPSLVRRLNNALMRTDQIHWSEGNEEKDWMVPIVADAEAGFGGNLNAFELMKHMIAAGASGVHFEDQLSSAKKCGHLGGKVLVPTQEAIHKLIAARLASDVLGVPTILIARTDADAANLLTSDIDDRDKSFCTGERSHEGFFYVNNGLEQSIARGLAYAPYCDMLWMETSKPNLEQARAFAEAIKKEFPDKMLAYNCSPSFNWKAHMNDTDLMKFREELNQMGYKFQFITLAGWHALNNSMFELATAFKNKGMYAYSNLQQKEFDNEPEGYRAIKHQAFVGTGYFDKIQNTITGGNASTIALSGSTEEEQFHS